MFLRIRAALLFVVFAGLHSARRPVLQSKRPIRRPKLHLRPTCSDIPTAAADAILDVESAGGRGISEALGLAGFTNLDVVRNPNLGPAPYLSQYIVH